jgi:hypothetical protein
MNPVPDPTVRGALLAKLDELVVMVARDLDEIRAVTDQLELDRAQSCRVVIRLTEAMLDEVSLRARGGPLDLTT